METRARRPLTCHEVWRKGLGYLRDQPDYIDEREKMQVFLHTLNCDLSLPCKKLRLYVPIPYVDSFIPNENYPQVEESIRESFVVQHLTVFFAITGNTEISEGLKDELTEIANQEFYRVVCPDENSTGS